MPSPTESAPGAVGSGSATRVARTIAFIDLSGFTGHTDTAGDDTAVEILALFRRIVRDVCSRHGVRIAKWLGDGAMLISVETEPILYALRSIVDQTTAAEIPLGLRTGVAAGQVILFEGDDYIGKSVNLAARLCDAADPGQVLAEASILAKLPPGTAAAQLGSREVAGFGEPVGLVDLALPVS